MLLALAVGDHALQVRGVMSFIVTDCVTLVGMFASNGFETVKPGAAKIVFDRPERIFTATISDPARDRARTDRLEFSRAQERSVLPIPETMMHPISA